MGIVVGGGGGMRAGVVERGSFDRPLAGLIKSRLSRISFRSGSLIGPSH